LFKRRNNYTSDGKELEKLIVLIANMISSNALSNCNIYSDPSIEISQNTIDDAIVRIKSEVSKEQESQFPVGLLRRAYSEPSVMQADINQTSLTSRIMSTPVVKMHGGNNMDDYEKLHAKYMKYKTKYNNLKSKK
jgi:hypothetical protein